MNLEIKEKFKRESENACNAVICKNKRKKRVFPLNSRLIFMGLIMSVFINIKAQQPLFLKSYGITSTPSDRQDGLKTTSDSGSVSSGFTYSIGNVKATLTKFDKFGTPLWNKRYHNVDGNGVFDIELYGSGFILGGSVINSPSINDAHSMLIRTDNLGNILWSKYYDFSIPYLNNISDVVKTSDGGIGFISTSDPTQPVIYTFVTKVDSSGNILWSKRIHPYASNAVYGWRIKEISNGNLIASGHVLSPSSSTGTLNYLIKFDDLGNTIWSKEYLITSYSQYSPEFSDGLFETIDGDIIVPFGILSFGLNLPFDPPIGREGPYMLKLDSNGNVKFCKDYGMWFSGFFGAKYLAHNNTLSYIMGRIDTASSNYNQGVFFTVDSIGRILISKGYNTPFSTYSWSGDGVGNSMDSTIYGGFISIGDDLNNTILFSVDGLGNAGGCFETDVCINPRCVPVIANNITGIINQTVVANNCSLGVSSGIINSTICSGISPNSNTVIDQTLENIYNDIEDSLLIPDTLYITSCNVTDTIWANYPVCKIDSVIWSWSTGVVNQSYIIISGPGIYWVEGAFYDCASSLPITLRDTVYVLASSPGFITVNTNANICPGSSFILPSGNIVNSAGIYNDTIISSSLCDSIIITTLSISPIAITSMNVNICQNQTYTLPSGNVANTSGTYIDTLYVGVCDSVVITNLTILPIQFSAINAQICEGDSYILPSGNMVYSAGTYIDTISSFYNCDSVITITLTVTPLPVMTISSDTTICNQTSLILNATGNGNYLWNTGQTSSSITVNPIVTSNYICTVFLNSCSVSDTTTVIVNSLSFDLGDNIDFCESENYILDVSIAADQFLWSTGSTGDTIHINQEGMYWLTATLGSCIETDTIVISGSQLGNTPIYIPNAFTPDGDNMNDCFYSIGNDIKEYHLLIFNRWGELIFESNNIDECWDGKYKNKPVKQDVYAWKLEYKTLCGKEKLYVKYGHVTVLK